MGIYLTKRESVYVKNEDFIIIRQSINNVYNLKYYIDLM